MIKYIIALVITVFALTSVADAGNRSRRIAYTKSCGHHVYQTKVFDGYDRCGHVVYRWVTQSSACGCNKKRPIYRERNYSYRSRGPVYYKNSGYYNRGHCGSGRGISIRF